MAEWQTEINKQQRELVAMQAALPSSVNLGLTALHLGKVHIHMHCTLASLHSPDAPPCPGLLGTMASTPIVAPVLNYPLVGSEHWLSAAVCTGSFASDILADNEDSASSDSTTTFCIGV